MERKTLHRLLIAGVAVLGVLLALVIGFVVFLRVAGPSVTSLAKDIDAEQALLFIRTDDKEFLLETVNRFGAIMGDDKPGPETFTVEGTMYEFAVDDKGWILMTHQGDTQWTNSSERTPPFPTYENSLAASPLFRNIGAATTSSLWFKTSVLPLSDSPMADLLHNGIGENTEGLVTWMTPTEGSLFLRAPAVAFWDAEPATLFNMIGLSLSQQNPALAEGLKGILQAKLKEWTGRTDLALFIQELLSEPMTISMTHNSGSWLHSYLISGSSASRTAITQWIDAHALTITDGLIRLENFYEGENTRVDVISSSAREDLGTRNGWALQRVGFITLAISGRRFIMGTEQTSVEKMIDQPQMPTSDLSVSMDMAWALETMDTTIPFLSTDLRTISRDWLGSPKRVSWDVSAVSHDLRIHWTLER